MGQSHSTPHNRTQRPTLANFYHVCNIIPDTPEHHHRLWSVPPPEPLPATPPPPVRHTTAKARRKPRRRAPLPAFLNDVHATTDDDSGSHRFHTTDYTTDDESDASWYAPKPSRAARPPVAPPSVAPPCNAPPARLDRRYDLDVAPSMLNMNLKFNGAYMVSSCVYNILACKFGYRHMLSVQMLFWEAIRRYYQTHRMDGTANYKLSLSSLLDVVQTTVLCSERELSIYTDIAKQQHNKPSDRGAPSPSTSNTFTLPKQTDNTQPFYRMQYYYVPKDTTTLKHALANDHLVLANLTLFSNFISARKGVVRPPNHDDQPAGMVVVTLVGYQEDDVWVVRFPFGLHWGDQGIGYVSFEYFDRYNRDRWLIDIDECSEPPEYRQQREAAQAKGDTAETGLLAVRMDAANGEPRVPPTQVPSSYRSGGGSAMALRRYG